MNLREAATLALEVLENHTAIKHPQQIHYRDAAIEALLAALAEPNKCTHGVTDGNCKECYIAEPDQEPVFDCPRCGHCCPQSKPLTEDA